MPDISDERLQEIRLTKAQLRELGDMASRDYRSYYSDHYAPIKRLLDLGLVDRLGAKYGSSTYAITDAGRALLTRRAKEAEPK